MEKDFQLASRVFWLTIRQLRKGKPSQVVLDLGGVLLTRTEDIVERWKEHFEDVLIPADMSFIEEAESEDFGKDSFITLPEVVEVIKKVDESRPDMLKALDMVELSWMIPDRVASIFKKGDRRVCSNYRGITLLSLPGKKVYSRVFRGSSEVFGQVVEQWTSGCIHKGSYG